MGKPLLALAVVFLFVAAAPAQPKGKEVHVKVEGTTREALVLAPAMASTADSPVVFVFHGHGGNAAKASDQFNIQKYWPQAIVVYMQGLPIPSKTDPVGKKAGWQHGAGQVEDRDLKFFDATLARLKKDYKVDDGRVYATGHSNGGSFSYLLWAERGDALAAVAPSSAGIANRYLKELKPKAALHVAGKKDEIASYEQQRKLMDALRALNGCADKGQAWHKLGTIYRSAGGTPFVELVHPGGHDFWDEAPKLIAAFFKEIKK